MCPVARPGHCEECGPPETFEQMRNRHIQEMSELQTRERREEEAKEYQEFLEWKKTRRKE